VNPQGFITFVSGQSYDPEKKREVMASRLEKAGATLSTGLACPASVRRAMAVILFGIFLPVPGLVVAQTSRGAVAGTVTDASGGLLPGVTVTARADATGSLRSVTTGPQGAYRLSELPPGSYALTFELAGLRTVRQVDAVLGRVRSVSDVNGAMLRPYAGRADRYFDADLRPGKSVAVMGRRLELMFEMFNLFNTVNNGGYIGNQRAVNFGQPTVAFAPFQRQLGVRLDF
jgi:hypothetical protein